MYLAQWVGGGVGHSLPQREQCEAACLWSWRCRLPALTLSFGHPLLRFLTVTFAPLRCTLPGRTLMRCTFLGCTLLGCTLLGSALLCHALLSCALLPSSDLMAALGVILSTRLPCLASLELILVASEVPKHPVNLHPGDVALHDEMASRAETF